MRQLRLKSKSSNEKEIKNFIKEGTVKNLELNEKKDVVCDMDDQKEMDSETITEVGSLKKEALDREVCNMSKLDIYVPAYQPLLARPTIDGLFYILSYKREVYALPNDKYTRMIKSVNRDEKKVELKVKGCYICHNQCHARVGCKSFPIPACSGCGRIGVKKTDCPTYTCLYMRKYGCLPPFRGA